MNRERWPRIWTIFEEAVSRSPAARTEFLDEACAGDPRLRRAVERMLSADQATDTLLDQPIFAQGAEWEKPEAAATPGRRLGRGTTIGPYRVLRRIGQGGMGTVYLAVRADDSFKRRVVVKLVRSGMESESIVERLRTERQILAGLDHPNVARLYDGGATEDGLPYFVMEYVEGVPIDAYCEQNELSVDERLSLFRRVCAPVHYAHQNLIVHRDIKPSNILVTADGEPKLLDFGIAKLLNPGLSATAQEPTVTWQRALTPNYASPEQIRGKLITTASDVYSLGVLLYRLLTGHLPRQLAGRSMDEIESLLTDSEPLPPSLAVNRELDDEPADSSRATSAMGEDGVANHQVSRQLAGDVDAILLKALRSAPRRRYSSVEMFAADIERYQRGLPVAARAGSWRYRAGKFVRRHRHPLAAAVAVAALVLGFAVAMTLQAARVAAERDQARSERDKKASVLALVRDLFELSNPYVLPGEELTVRQALERSVPVLENGLQEQPEIRAELLHTSGLILGVLGAARSARGQLVEALAIRRRFLGEEHPDVVETMTALAAAYKDLGDYDEAETLANRALTIASRLWPPQHPELAKPLNELVAVMCHRDQFEFAEEPAARAMHLTRELLPGGLDRIAALEHMARVRNAQGDYVEAARLGREALALIRARFGEKHPRQIVTLDNLGFSLRRMEELVAAERAYQEAMALQQEIFGDEHPNVFVLNNLAGVRYAMGELDSAAELYRRALDAIAEDAGSDHWMNYFFALRIEKVRIRQGEAAQAEGHLRRLLERWRPKLGEHWQIDEGTSLLGASLSVQGRCRQAEELLVGSFERLLGRSKERTQRDALERLREHFERCGKPQEIVRFADMLAAA